MAIVERMGSREINVGVEVAAVLTFLITEAAEEADARSALEAELPAFLNIDSSLGLQTATFQNYEVKKIGNLRGGIWDAIARYARRVPKKTGDFVYTFEIGGGMQHITQSKETVRSYTKGPVDPVFELAILTNATAATDIANAAAAGAHVVLASASTDTMDIEPIPVAIEFDQELTDSDGYHDTVTNNDRITIPAGLGGRYMVSAYITFNIATIPGQQVSVGIYKNGELVDDLDTFELGSEAINRFVESAVDVVEGDYLQVMVSGTAGGEVVLTDDVSPWFFAGKRRTSSTVAAPDLGGAINYNNDTVSGVDIHQGTYKWSETWYMPRELVTPEYRKVLARIAEETPVNNRPFREFNAGEVLFLGASGSERGVDDVELTFHFERSKNASDITIGDMTGIVKDGWEYLWIRYRDSTDQNKIIKIPDSVYIEKVYESGDFRDLGIGEDPVA